MRKPTNTRRMLPHAPYRETLIDWTIVIVVLLILGSVVISQMGVCCG